MMSILTVLPRTLGGDLAMRWPPRSIVGPLLASLTGTGHDFGYLSVLTECTV